MSNSFLATIQLKCSGISDIQEILGLHAYPDALVTGVVHKEYLRSQFYGYGSEKHTDGSEEIAAMWCNVTFWRGNSPNVHVIDTERVKIETIPISRRRVYMGLLSHVFRLFLSSIQHSSP